jgi:predicted MPP superfamily phosphohydrolase
VLVLGVVMLACAALPEPKHRASVAAPREPPRSIVVIGDTQRSLWAEEHVLEREQNEHGRVALIDQLAAEENPALVVLLGDMVAASSARQWEYFASLMSPLAGRDLRILPVLGNHEYFGAERDPTRRVRRRFPDLAHGGYYAKQLGRLGLVFLDSNLSGTAGKRELAWLERILTGFERDPSVRAVVAFTHHPPHTNGVEREGTPLVQDEILPRLERSTKGVLLVAAHVHGYERFPAEEGVTVVITGGGGGPRVGYRVGAARSKLPAWPREGESPAARPLHYVVLEDRGATLRLTARCLRTDPACPRGLMDEHELPLP